MKDYNLSWLLWFIKVYEFTLYVVYVWFEVQLLYTVLVRLNTQ